MNLLLIVLLPFAGALLPPLAGRLGRGAAAWTAAFVPAAALLLALEPLLAAFAGTPVTVSRPWLPQAGVDLALRMDGLAALFILLILGIGLLIILYANYYLAEDDSPGRFFALLLLFMGAMVGIVLSDGLLQLLVFWELTSLSSFLLIGFRHRSAEARQGARMALTVTGAGGLALLAGFLLLGRIAGSYQISVIIGMGDIIRAHPLYVPTLLLILLGAFTKSAQVPFHFWLPQAMAAPTPVSAYLHSATMVKAGVFLLARLFPALAGTDLWFLVVGGTGLVTLSYGAYTPCSGMISRACRPIPRSVISALSCCCSASIRRWRPWPASFISSITPPSRPRCSWPPALSTTKPAPATCAASTACGHTCRLPAPWRWLRPPPWPACRCSTASCPRRCSLPKPCT
jgi:multicomponent K+:H+ antiporter subunit A